MGLLSIVTECYRGSRRSTPSWPSISSPKILATWRIVLAAAASLPLLLLPSKVCAATVTFSAVLTSLLLPSCCCFNFRLVAHDAANPDLRRCPQHPCCCRLVTTVAAVLMLMPSQSKFVPPPLLSLLYLYHIATALLPPFCLRAVASKPSFRPPHFCCLAAVSLLSCLYLNAAKNPS